MTQIYRDENGQEHEFPDDATPQEIDEATRPKSQEMSAQDKQDKFKQIATGGPLQDAASGFTQGVMNLPGGIANLGVSGINALTGSNIPKVPQFDFAPKNIASTVGDIGSAFVGPNELLKLLKYANESKAGNALSKIPGIADAIEGAGNLINKYPTISKTVGNSLIGGAYSPDHPLWGIAAGAGSVPAGKALGAGYDLFKNSLNKITPEGLGKVVQSGYDNLKKYAVDYFDIVGKEAEKRGVSKIPIDQKLIEDSEKYFPKTQASKKLIENAKSGNYEDVKNLQSDLWKRGTENKSSEFEADRIKGEEALDLRDRINEVTRKHFVNSGNPDLAHNLDIARNAYRHLNETYFGDNTPRSVSNMVKEGSRKIPNNIINVLSENSDPMKALYKTNPLIETSLNELIKKQSARKFGKNALKYGVGTLAGVGALNLGHEAYNALK